jgi:hypothetical protein
MKRANDNSLPAHASLARRNAHAAARRKRETWMPKLQEFMFRSAKSRGFGSTKLFR